MNFFEAIKSYFRNYATFKGRASRSEFWFAVMFLLLAQSVIDTAFPGTTERMWDIDFPQSSAMSQIWSTLTLVPSLAITWRRLHDVDKSGKYFFWILLPIAGVIMLLVQYCKAGTPEANRFGDPVK